MNSNATCSPQKKRLLIGLAAVEIIFKLCALRDINRRPADQIRGSKRQWRLALIVNFFGPAAYFIFGRRD